MLKRIISMMLALFMVLSACPIVYMSENEAIETLNEAAQEGTDTEDAAAEDAEKTQDPADESNSLSQNEESEENAEGQETAASDEANQNPSSDYMQITADAVYHKADITAPEGLAVVEAFVIDQANCDAVQLTLTALPSLSDGETLVFCGLMDDAAEAILENVQVGDTAVVALNAFNGFALMKRLAMVQEANPIEASEEEKNEAAPADPDEVPAEGSNETGNVETADGKSDKSETDANSDNPDPEEEDEEKKDESEDKTETILKKRLEASDGKTYQVFVSYSGNAGFPEEAELCVSEIAKDEKSYSTFINKAAQAVYLSSTDFSYVRLFDLSILGADGKAYPLDDTVSVKIDLLEEADTSDLRVVKIGNRTEEVDAEVEDASVSFEADESASVFAIVNVSLFEQEISASMKTAEGTKSGTLYENDDILLTGKMPSMGIVEAEPVSVEIEGQKVLAAYDIKIYANRLMKTLGISWQPSDGTIQVQVKSAVMDNVNTVSVYHIADGESAPELVQEEVAVENGAVSFAAESFSVYVVVDHEDNTIVTPRVVFHFISGGAAEYGTGSSAYYVGEPYGFKNKGVEDDSTDPVTNYTQTTQILKDGESLELITDPANQNEQYFYGWYIVDPYVIDGTTDEYGIGTADQKLYFRWPETPDRITFESPISIEESSVSASSTVHWSLNGLSGSGEVDAAGDVHVFLAPLFEKYRFVNFMLRPRNASGSNNLMTRKLIALGSATYVEVKIGDIRANSTDPIHLVFAGWEYYDAANDTWITKQTVEYSGAPLQDPGRDSVYLSVDQSSTEDVDLYPVFIEARWVDFFSGVSGSGATYVASRFLESWGRATETNPPQDVADRNVFTELSTSTRPGYAFEGWYAFANVDPTTGEITNLDTPENVTVKYLTLNGAEGYVANTITVNTTAIKIANADGTIDNSGTWSVTDNGNGTGTLYNDDQGQKLLQASDGKVRLFDSIDRLTLYANWAPDNTQITVIYWTENVQDKDYVQPQNEKDDYTASAVKVITTEELNQQSGTIGTTFASGSTISLAQLGNYQENETGILDRTYLDNIGAVLPGEEKFYDLNTELSDATAEILGDGSTVYNVYFSRKTFKIIFHIGRDGYVKNGGHQKTDDHWDGNWIEFMYKDPKVGDLGYPTPGGTGRNPADSISGVFSMTYLPTGETYTSEYVTTNDNVMGDYVPTEADTNLYVLEAKYGAYIGNRWPTPTNPNFSFIDAPNKNKTLYIWAAYYGSLYCRIANERSTVGNEQGANPDINGVYEYMSAELCSNRAGTEIINANQVHHLVAYFGNSNNTKRYKKYHILYEAISGTYDPATSTVVSGDDYQSYNLTTWSQEHTAGDKSEILGHSFIEQPDSPKPIISNLEPQFQLTDTIDGYEQIYSCYDPNQRTNSEDPTKKDYHIYFFFKPKEYTLTFNMGSTTRTDPYSYTQSLADADKYSSEVVVPEGYEFIGWFTNTEGVGDPFDFANEKMPSQNVVLYPVLRVLQYTVKIDPNGGVIDHINYDVPDFYGNKANDFGVLGSGYQTSQATYFTADYGTPIGEYSISRGYIMLTDKERDPDSPSHYTGTEYYYLNTQFDENADGDWGLPPNLRNAVYMEYSQLESYYEFYKKVVTDNAGYYTNVAMKQTLEEFLEAYTSYPNHPYRPLSGGEHYTFMGWYQVLENGTVASMPYNFNDPVKGPLELRALWRLDGGYYIQYNPYYFAESDGTVTAVVGELQHWADPEDPTLKLYADQSPTHIMKAPTNVTPGWVFRGWRVVRENGTVTFTGAEGELTRTNWEPFGELKYYQPGDSFTIDSELVTEITGTGKIIHMQAYYEPESTTYRKPDVTNLVLDSNDEYYGFVNTTDSTALPALIGPGSTYINTEDHLYSGHPTQILFGDIQSSIALHLYQYATTKTFNSIQGTNFFDHRDSYLLIGFDEERDPDAKHYIPAYAADSVIAVTRNSSETLYAMWEPMVYATFVNTTNEDITVELTGTGTDTVRIVNQVTGEFDRERRTTTIVIPAKSGEVNGEVKVVFPKAVAGVDNVIATTTNDRLSKLMSVSGSYRNAEPTSPYGTGSEHMKYGNPVVYTGVLQTDAEGIVITYTEDINKQVIYDVNGGNWNPQPVAEPFKYSIDDIYYIEAVDIINGSNYEPEDPTREGKIFIGWTTNADIAAQTDFSSENAVTWGITTITPDEGGIVLDKVRSDYLWDFSQDAALLYDNDETLYAVWSDTVTVTFNIAYSRDPSTNPQVLHTWTDSETTLQVPYEFYRSEPGQRLITYTMAKGERVLKPSEPTATTATTDWSFVSWLLFNNTTNPCRYTANATTNNTLTTYAFDFSSHVNSDVTLVTSWTEAKPQIFTFTVKNEVVGGTSDIEFEYTIAVSDELVLGKLGNSSSNSVGTPDRRWGSITTTLKNNEEYTVNVKVSSAGNSNSVQIDVIDCDGIVIKSGHVIYCNKNSVNKYFVSDYKYTLTISQNENADYETTVSTEDLNGNIISSTNDDARSFTFMSSMSRTPAQSSYFTPEINAFEAGNNSLTIVFRNRSVVLPAPTDFHVDLRPFIWMICAGAAFVLLALLSRGAVKSSRKRRT